jgi:hypothetical protein
MHNKGAEDLKNYSATLLNIIPLCVEILSRPASIERIFPQQLEGLHWFQYHRTHCQKGYIVKPSITNENLGLNKRHLTLCVWPFPKIEEAQMLPKIKKIARNGLDNARPEILLV